MNQYEHVRYVEMSNFIIWGLFTLQDASLQQNFYQLIWIAKFGFAMNGIRTIKENEVTREYNVPHNFLKAQQIPSRVFRADIFKQSDAF